MEEKQQEVAAPPAEITPEEQIAKAQEFAYGQWNAVADAERIKIAKRRGLLPAEPGKDATEDDRKTYTAKVKAIAKDIALEGDTLRYAKDRDGNPRIVTGRFGMPAYPKQHGRRRHRMNKAGQTLKSTAIGIFRNSYPMLIEKLEAEAKAAGLPFNGVPVEELSKLSTKSALLAKVQVRQGARDKRRRKRNEAKLQRRINAGVLPGNTNRRAYVIN